MPEEEKTAPEETKEPEKPKTAEERIGALEDVVAELIDQMEKLSNDIDAKLKSAGVKPKGLFGGKRARTPTKDLKTGVVYVSKAAVGKAFAAEINEDPLDSMVFYKVIAKLKMPDGNDRFVDAGEEEATKAIADFEAQQAKEVEEANKKLQEEEAAKAAAAKKEEQAAQGKKK